MSNKYTETLFNLKDPANIGMLMGLTVGSLYYMINAKQIYIPGLLLSNVYFGLIGRGIGDAFIPDRPPSWEFFGF